MQRTRRLADEPDAATFDGEVVDTEVFEGGGARTGMVGVTGDGPRRLTIPGVPRVRNGMI